MMQPDDKVYYLYTDQYNNQIKYAALVISVEEQSALIRVGKFDVMLQEVKTFESVVPLEKLSPRSTPCSFEKDLQTSN